MFTWNVNLTGIHINFYQKVWNNFSLSDAIKETRLEIFEKFKL
jgi:hypothetical protein